MEHKHDTGEITQDVRHGNCVAALLDPSLLEVLPIDEYTLLHVELDRASIILVPTDTQKPKFRSAMCDDYVLSQRSCQC